MSFRRAHVQIRRFAHLYPRYVSVFAAGVAHYCERVRDLRSASADYRGRAPHYWDEENDFLRRSPTFCICAEHIRTGRWQNAITRWVIASREPLNRVAGRCFRPDTVRTTSPFGTMGPSGATSPFLIMGIGRRATICASMRRAFGSRRSTCLASA